MVDRAGRQKILDESPGTGDIISDRWGVNALQPKDRAVVKARGASNTPMPVEASAADRLDVLPPWFWNPSNPLARKAPPGVADGKRDKIRKSLKGVDKRLDITFNPERKVWQVWFYKPGFMKEAPWANGWVHLKDFKQHQNSDYVLQTIMAMDQTNKSLSRHYSDVKSLRQQDLERNRARRKDEAAQIGGDMWDHMQIRVGYGKSNGSKFSRYG